MIRKICNNKTAVIILHEIYGINQFIQNTCTEYHNQGFDVFAPNMIGTGFFDYSEAPEAYEFFKKNVGFDYFKNVELLAAQLKVTYEKVFIIGFSVGATIAWRCCENLTCDAVVCCYGSRIRDYLSIQPSCHTLLLFAEEDTFDVSNLIKQLAEKSNVELHKFTANHGFIDQYSNCFNREQAQRAKEYIIDFLMGDEFNEIR